MLARADGERNIEKRVLLRAGIAVGNPFQLDGLRRGVRIAFEAARAAVCFGIGKILVQMAEGQIQAAQRVRLRQKRAQIEAKSRKPRRNTA